MTKILARWTTGLAAAAMLIATGSAALAEYPDRAITMIVPAPPGGGTTIAARILADALAAKLGQPVVVDNKPEGDGVLAMTLLARAPADGYTLAMVTHASLAFNPSLYKDVTYDPVKDFSHVALVAWSKLVLAVGASANIKDFKEFEAYAKANPGKLNYATASIAGLLIGNLIEKTVGFKMNPVSYGSSGQATVDLLGGRLDATITNPTPLLPHIKAGKVIPIASTSKGRNKALPDTPSLYELGYTAIDVAGWYGVSAPAGTPDAIVKKLNSEILAILKDPAVQEKFDKAGVDFVTDDYAPEAFAKFVGSEYATWSQAIKDAGIPRQ